MNKIKRGLMILTVLVLVCCLFGCELRLPSLLEHDCADTHCQVCLLIASIERLRSMCEGTIYLLLFAVLPSCLDVCFLFCRHRYSYPDTPILQKVKFSC